jgi:hypothetical protein
MKNHFKKNVRQRGMRVMFSPNVAVVQMLHCF